MKPIHTIKKYIGIAILSFICNTSFSQDMAMGLEPLTDEKIEELENAYDQYIGGGEELYNMVLKDVGNPQEPRFDLREVDALPAIRNQKTCGSCWAFSAIASLESSNLLINGKSDDLSEQQLVDCVSYVQKNVGGCNGGHYAIAFQWLLESDKGLNFETQIPYQNTQNSCAAVDKGELKVASWKSIGRNPTRTEIKQAIVQHGALSASMNASSKTVLNYDPSKKELMDDPNINKVSHAINVVGWDDEKGAWLIRNSWGELWGDKGYGWIKYGTQDLTSFSWVDVNVVDNKKQKEEIAEEKKEEPQNNEVSSYTLDLVQVLGSIQEYQELIVAVDDKEGKRFGMNKKGLKYHNKIEITSGKHDLVIYTKSIVKRKNKKAMLFGFWTGTIEMEKDETIKISYQKKKVKEPNVFSLNLGNDDILVEKK